MCSTGVWPGSNLGAFYEPSDPVDKQAWMGSLTDGKSDASGFRYMRNRYYNPQTGSFTHPDPIGIAGGLNVYGYGEGNPVKYDDPFGLCPPCAVAVVVVAEEGGGALLGGTLAEYLAAGSAGGILGIGVAKLLPDQRELQLPAPAAQQDGVAWAQPINRQKQAGHVVGTPQYNNRLKQGRPTSAFPDATTADQLTQEAYDKGAPLPGRPNVREHDFGRTVGTSPNGRGQTRVRVHEDQKGCIHGHPSGPEC